MSCPECTHSVYIVSHDGSLVHGRLRDLKLYRTLKDGKPFFRVPMKFCPVCGGPIDNSNEQVDTFQYKLGEFYTCKVKFPMSPSEPRSAVRMECVYVDEYSCQMFKYGTRYYHASCLIITDDYYQSCLTAHGYDKCEQDGIFYSRHDGSKVIVPQPDSQESMEYWSEDGLLIAAGWTEIQKAMENE